jgi:hypothetical protein
MPIFGSRPDSRPGSVPSSRIPSRATSPTPGGHPSKLDSIRIEGNLYDVLKPRPAPTHETEVLPKEVHVMLKYTVSFTLSKAVHAESLKAEFVGTMHVIVDQGDGQFTEAETMSDEITSLRWVLWRGDILEAGKEYVFEITGELPPKTPRSLRTPSGMIEHVLTVRLDGVTDSGRMRRTRKTIEVWNPFSMDADSPRPGLEFHGDLEPEMFGTTVEIDKDLEAFMRLPDQCFKGILSK